MKHQACNDHVQELAERYQRLIEGAVLAVEEGNLERANLFNSSAERCAKDIEKFIGSMAEAGEAE